MAVLIEAISILIKESSILREFPSIDQFGRTFPNNGLCHDGDVLRLGFTNRDELIQAIDSLCAYNFKINGQSENPDFVVIDQVKGFFEACDWIMLKRMSIDPLGHKPIIVASIVGSHAEEFSIPQEWDYEVSISKYVHEEHRKSILTPSKMELAGPSIMGNMGKIFGQSIRTIRYRLMNYQFKKKTIDQEGSDFYFSLSQTNDTISLEEEVLFAMKRLGAHSHDCRILGWNYWRYHLGHFSFGCGNALYYVYIEIGKATYRSIMNYRKTNFLEECKARNAIPCIMPLERGVDGKLMAVHPGWGLLDARTGQRIEPFYDEKVQPTEMGFPERHAMSMRQVLETLNKLGTTVVKYSMEPGAYPSIWIKDGAKYNWIQVISSVYPNKHFMAPNLIVDMRSNIIINENNHDAIMDGWLNQVMIKNALQEVDGVPLAVYLQSELSFEETTHRIDHIYEYYQKMEQCDDPTIHDDGPLTEKDALIAYATMINTLDIFALEEMLAENFSYDSQRKADSLTPKSAFLEYMSEKLKTVRKAGIKPRVELGTVIDRGSMRNCAIIDSNVAGTPEMLVLATTADGEISNIVLCDYPSPRNANRTGVFPGLSKS